MKTSIAIKTDEKHVGSAEKRAGTTNLRWVLASLSLSMLLSSLGTSIANVALPTLALAFHAPFQQVQWVVLAYLLAITTAIVSVGALGDLIGRRRLLLAGLALFSCASVLCALAPTLAFLIASRAAQGLGAAIMMALTMALVAEAVPREKVGRAMGLLGSMSALGTALGPSLGGFLIAGFAWPAIFLVNLPLGILGIVLAYRYLPKEPYTAKKIRPKFDTIGTVVLAATLAAYALAMTMGHGAGAVFKPGALNLVMLLAALFGVVLFVWVETKAVKPLLSLALFRDPLLSAGCAMSTLVTTVVMATLVIGPFYLSGALALGASQVGLVMSAGPIVAALSGLPAGRMVDRFGAARMSVAGLIVMLLGCLAMSLLPASWGVPAYLAALVLITAGYALFQAANNTAVMAQVSPEQRGVISGVLSLSRNLGLISGASMMGAVFALATGATNMLAAHPLALARGLRISFALAALFIVVALALASFSLLSARRGRASPAAMKEEFKN